MDQLKGEAQSHAPVYANASPLIAFARIDRLELLRILPLPVRVTAEVWQEIAADPGRPGAQRLLAAAGDLLAIVDEGNPADFPLLDPGEASVLSAARAAGGAVIIDERKARTVLETNPDLHGTVPYLTTTAALVLAKRRGIIPHVRPLLDDLRRESFRVSERHYEDTLRAAGEWPVE